MALFEAKDLKKNYLARYIPVNAIRGVSFSLPPASFVSFIGPSGSGLIRQVPVSLP
jgi:putative ABC transport system ATP-binding protein